MQRLKDAEVRLGDHVGLKTGEQGNMRRVLADQLTETVVAILARALGAARRTRRRGEGMIREAAALCALAREAVVGVHLGAVDVEMLKNTCAPILPVGHRADERAVGRIAAHVTGGPGLPATRRPCCPSDRGKV